MSHPGAPPLRLAVCEAAPDLRPGDDAWRRLAAATRAADADILVLNEMPFGPWLAAGERPDPEATVTSCQLHKEGLALLPELGVPLVLGSRPVQRRGATLNEAFIWQAGDAGSRAGAAGLPADDSGSRGEGAGRTALGSTAAGSAASPPGPALRSAGHTKQFFPDEEGYREARWFRPGKERFGIARIAVPGGPGERLAVGFLICTDVWFNERARSYGRGGAHLIAVPRATPVGSTGRWRTAVRMAALVSGCYTASSNRTGADSRGQSFGGRGWIFSPDGDLLAETTPEEPVVAAELDLARARRAKSEYPRYVEEPARD